MQLFRPLTRSLLDLGRSISPRPFLGSPGCDRPVYAARRLPSLNGSCWGQGASDFRFPDLWPLPLLPSAPSAPPSPWTPLVGTHTLTYLSGKQSLQLSRGTWIQWAPQLLSEKGLSPLTLQPEGKSPPGLFSTPGLSSWASAQFRGRIGPLLHCRPRPRVSPGPGTGGTRRAVAGVGVGSVKSVSDRCGPDLQRPGGVSPHPRSKHGDCGCLSERQVPQYLSEKDGVPAGAGPSRC